MTTRVTLDLAPLHTPLVLVESVTTDVVQRRLTALGLRRGVGCQVVQRLAGGGRVVAVGGGRLALGRDVLVCLTGEVLG